MRNRHDIKQDAVLDGRFRPRCCHLGNGMKHTHRLRARSICSVMWKHDVIHKTGST